MPTSVPSFDRITIAAPCDADWELMLGTDQVRFCEHCRLHVTNLSAMTRPEAMRLVERHRGRLCVRYLQTTSGEILNLQASQQIYQIGRRVSRLAAAAFTATLGVAGAAAQNKPDLNSAPPTQAAVSVTTIPAEDIAVKVEPPRVEPQMGRLVIREPRDPLIKAAMKDDVNAVRELIPVTQDLNKWDEATNTSALGYAIENHNREMIRLLVQAGASANSTAEYGRSPLMFLNGDATTDLVNDLLSAGADVNANDKSNNSVLASVIGRVPLAIVKQLIEAGARIDGRDDDGNTVLMRAAENDDPGVVQFLLALGVDTQPKNNYEDSAVTIAARSGKGETLKALIDAGGRFDLNEDELTNVFMQAIGSGDPAVVKMMIAAGVDPEATESGGRTALMQAAQYAKPETVKILIDAGVDLNRRDDDGLTAIMQATDVENVRVLLSGGADVSLKNKDGKTALGKAIADRQNEIVEFLRSRGAPK